jgi:RNA polymerase sigma-70 factor (ECF subfamily)
MQPDDAAVLRRASDGDEDAFRLLVERHGRRLYRLAYRMTGSAEDAEDVVQDAFVRAHRQMHRFEARAQVATWLHRIAFNCAVDHLRRRRVREVPGQPAVIDGHVDTRHPGADALVYANEIGARVQAALGTLSAQERAAFLLRHEQGGSIEDVCHALHVNTNAAKHAVFRAVKKMRAALRPFAAAAAGPEAGEEPSSSWTDTRRKTS